jgi:GTP pyrophosphokinase
MTRSPKASSKTNAAPPSKARMASDTAAPKALASAAPVAMDGLPPSVIGMMRRIDERFPGTDSQLVGRAYFAAEEAHRGQNRASGEPYIVHPLAVALILDEMGLDPGAIAAALLHDVVEDTSLDEAEVAERFGKEVARLVAGVTKISAIEAREKAAAEAESLRRMLLASVNDLRVILIKLADRLHNMQTLDALKPDKRERMARETLEIYAPLANRLGIWQIKSAFEDLVLRELEPEVHREIEAALADRRDEHAAYLADVIATLDETLRESGIEAEIKSRTKHIYSIYRKMKRKELGADQIYDVLAVRVLVDELPQCYLALGAVHAMWPPLGGEFDDFIAKRKDNLYQSLHTTVLGPGKRPLEVQIRTHEMNELAEYGVAAHWKYKENSRHSADFQEKIATLRRILESHDADAPDAESFVEGLKTDVFSDQVYVFTPRGDVIEMPAGSTPVDFAYHIHSEVGHRCRGALVDNRIVALDRPLATGQTVSVITTKGPGGPSRDWLNPALGYVTSNRARSKIKQWFRRQARSEAVRAGREVLEKQLRKLGMTRMRLDEVPKLFGHEKLDDFLAAVGRHEIASEQLSARLLETEAGRPPVPAHTDARVNPRGAPPTGTAPRPKLEPAAGVTLRGADGIHTRVARCCTPLPGEKAVGYVTRGKGVTLHRKDCPNIIRTLEREPERFIRVNWQNTERQAYPVELRISAYDRSGLVRDITEVMSLRDVNVTSLSATAHPADGTAVVTVIVEMSSHDRLSGLIDKLGMIENVIEVRRPTG